MSSKLETFLALQLRSAMLPQFERELRFHPDRKWRLDFAWADVKLAVEVQGGTHLHGAGSHAGGKYGDDCEKLAEATLAGWRVLWCTSEQVMNGQALAWVERAFGRAVRTPVVPRLHGRKGRHPRSSPRAPARRLLGPGALSPRTP